MVRAARSRSGGLEDPRPGICSIFQRLPNESRPLPVECSDGPFPGFALRRDSPMEEREQEAAEREHQVGLLPAAHRSNLSGCPCPVRVLLSAGESFSLQVRGGNRVDEQLGVGTGEDHSVFTKEPSDNRGVAVGIPDELLRAVVQIEERLLRPVQAAQLLAGDVRALQVLRPGGLDRVQPTVQQLQVVLLIGGELFVTDDHKIDVAELVSVARCERAVEVRSAEVVPEAGAGTIDKLGEHGVKLRVSGRLRDGREGTEAGSNTSAPASSR
jgi:hypothetical protein